MSKYTTSIAGHIVPTGSVLEVFIKAHIYTNAETLQLMWFNSSRAKNHREFLKFNTIEALNRYVDSIKEKLTRSEKIKQEYKASKTVTERSAAIGDIFVRSWGYEQTNVDYYQVVGFKGKKSYIVQKIHSALSAGEGCSSMSGYCVPLPNNFIESKEPMSVIENRKNQISLGKGNTASLLSYTLDENNERVYQKSYCSWYA